MTEILSYDRVWETTLAGGLGDIVLGQPVRSYRSFADVFAAAPENTYFHYGIDDETNDEFEIGEGQYVLATNAIHRLAVLLSTNNNNLVNFEVGTTKRVFIAQPESVTRQIHCHQSDLFTLAAQDIVNKFVSLTYKPMSSSVHLGIAGAPSQLVGVNYTVDVATQRVSWQGTTLESILRVGHQIVVNYALRPQRI